MISLEKYKSYCSLINSTLKKKSFGRRLLFEGINDESFACEVTDLLNTLSQSVTSAKLDSILSELREKTIKHYNDSKYAVEEAQKVDNALRSLAYFYLLESIDEYSSISDNVVEEIKTTYPSDYLTVITNADKMVMSKDMKKDTEKVAHTEGQFDDCVNKYLVLKKWQDSQHYFFIGEYWNYLEKVHVKYVGNPSLKPFILEQEALKKRLIISLMSSTVLDIDTCSILTVLDIKADIIELIGGKMYGLAVLNYNGIKIPYTVVVPTYASFDQTSFTFLNPNKRYSCRSSANIEDGENNSFAGMFDSFLNVAYDDVYENVLKVKASVNNERLNEYIKEKNLSDPNMAVVIQIFEEPTYAGVWIGNSNSTGVLEWVNGNGEKLVSGSSIPTTEFWNENVDKTGFLNIKGEYIGDIMINYQSKVKCNADFEWMILNDELVMLQFRPVTRNVIEGFEEINKCNAYRGIPASQGLVTGEGVFLNSPKESLEEGKILLAIATDPDWIPNIIKAKGAVTAMGGFLCHTAIVCRELGIPCVTGVGRDAIFAIAECSKIEINGSNGSINILE